MVKFGKLNYNFKGQIINVYNMTFGEEYKTKFNKLFELDNEYWNYVFGLIEDDNLVAVHSCIPVQTYIRNKIIDAHYLSYVGTLPSYRNKGCAKRLFLEEITKCQQMGIDCMIFDPFKHSYYKKWGCEIAFDTYYLYLNYSLLSKQLSDSNYQIYIGYLRQNEIVRELYKNIRNYFWNNPLYNEMKIPSCYEDALFYNSNTLIAIVCSQNREPKGYIRYIIENRSLIIYEYRYVDLSAFYKLKEYLLAFRDQIDKFIFESIPPDFPIQLLFDDYWKEEGKAEHMIQPSRMIRIIDARKIIEKLMVKHPSTIIKMRIIDELIEANNNTFEITTNGEVFVSLDKEDFTIHISDLVSLISGRMSIMELYSMGKIETSNSVVTNCTYNKQVKFLEEVNQIFPKSITFAVEEM